MPKPETHRKSDLHQIKVALEAYYNDHNSYPLADGCPSGTCGADSADYTTNYSNLSSSYITTLPLDPVNATKGSGSSINGCGAGALKDAVCATNNYAYSYVRSGDGQHFVLYARLENASDPQACPTINYTFPMQLSFNGVNFSDCQTFVTTDPGEAGLYYLTSN